MHNPTDRIALTPVVDNWLEQNKLECHIQVMVQFYKQIQIPAGLSV